MFRSRRNICLWWPQEAVKITVEDQLDPSWMAILTDPVRLSVLLGLCQLRAATTSQLRTMCHTSDPTLRRHLQALEALGIVRQEPAERDGVTWHE